MWSYAELLQRPDAPPGSSWGLWGDDDDLGTLNFINRETVGRAAACVRTGERINLDRTLPTVAPGIDEPRLPRAAIHHIYSVDAFHGTVIDDYLDGFYLQARSQIDGLRHSKHPTHGFYNGATREDIVANNPRLGIGRFSEAGIVGRGVLLDVPRHMTGTKGRYDSSSPVGISVGTLEAVAAAQGVVFHPGDILLLRTGAPTFEEPGFPTGPGLEQSHRMLAWLWDHQFAMVASDNAAVEVIPPVRSSPFRVPEVAGMADGLMHPNLIALLGFAVGEQFDLERLAAACASDGVYDSLVIAKPLNIVGGAGSPSNSLAIR